MKPYSAAYVPIGVPTFHLESAQQQFEVSAALLRRLCPDVTVPGKMLLTLPDLAAYLDTLEAAGPDLIVLQNVTFANAAYAAEVCGRFSCPVLLWTLREPVQDGGRLRLNSLTGAYSAANTMKALGVRFLYVYGAPQEEAVEKTLRAVLEAGRVRSRMRGLRIASVGHTPQGFGFGRALDTEMQAVFGARLESIEARELIARAESCSEEDCRTYLDKAQQVMCGLEKTPEKNRLDFARLCKAYFSYVEENGIGALSSRCWPDFFTAYGTPVCGVLALLNDAGIAASCEADAYGALSMYAGMQLTGQPVFFGDPVSLNEDENALTFWHCGMAACSLARRDTGAQVGVHPNRRIGPTLEFGCRAASDVTVYRFGRTPEGKFRLFVLSGEALDKPRQFSGTSLVVGLHGSRVRDVVEKSVLDGWEPHFAVAYGAIGTSLEALAAMLGIEVCRY